MIVWGRDTDAPPTSKLDDAESSPECRWCHAAIHDGDCCIECWRDRRAIALDRDREWWAS